MLLGAAGGGLCALADLAWALSWSPDWGERARLLLRLLGLLVPLGAALGAAFGAWHAGTQPPVARLARRLREEGPGRERLLRLLGPLPHVLLCSPALVAVGWLLFTGGQTSRLAHRGLWVAGASLALLLGAWLALALGAASLRWAKRGRGVRILLVSASATTFVTATALDRHVLPGLYDYLHALLGAAAWLLAALAVALLSGTRGAGMGARSRRRAILLLVGLAAVLVIDLVTLDRDPNVRVALFDPRTPTARSVMQGLEPLLSATGGGGPDDAAVAAARQARERRRRGIDASGLPSHPGAHLLLVTVDALRADHLGLHGYDRGISPILDALAERSVVFDHAYAQAPHSSYSVCSLMTSEYLHEVVDIGAPLPQPTLAGTLGEADYGTHAFYTRGVFHTEGERLLGYRDDDLGFGTADHRSYDAEERTDVTLALAERIASEGERPTLFWVHYFDVHEPYEDTSLGTAALDRYDGEIRNVDRALGRLLEGMEERLEREIVLIVTADHGEEFRDHGGVYHGSTLYDEQVRVPLLVRAPGFEPRHVEAPVELVDAAPTALGLLGVGVPGTMRGDDLRAMMLGRTREAGPAFAGVGRKRMVVRWPHKLIADLRFGLYQLYDLAADPDERHNLAGQEPALREALTGELYAWIDSLRTAPGDRGEGDPRLAPMARARLGDRSSAPALAALLSDATLTIDQRVEAARLLGGLANPSTADAAFAVSQDAESDPRIAVEATVALGRMSDARAREPLRALLRGNDPDLRARGANALARFEQEDVVPALIEALDGARPLEVRSEAILWLGRRRDPRGVPPLIGALTESRLRRRAAVALGLIGDARAYDPLVSLMDTDRNASIRDNVVRALGQLGGDRALPLLVEVAATEPGLSNTGESLVRLDGIGRGVVGGTDVGPGLGRAAGFGSCEAGATHEAFAYAGRTHCTTSGPRARLPLTVPDVLLGEGDEVIVLLRARRVDADGPVEVRVAIGEGEPTAIPVDGQWTDHRWAASSELLGAPGVHATIEPADEDARLRVDHLLLIPPARGPLAGRPDGETRP